MKRNLFTLWAILSLYSFSHAANVNIQVDASQVVAHLSPYLTGLCLENLNHEIYGGFYNEMIFGESFQEAPAVPPNPDLQISKMWTPIKSAQAKGKFELIPDGYLHKQSQRMAFVSGSGEVGIANSGLNQLGLELVANKPYDGTLRIKTAQATAFTVRLENNDGSTVFASTDLEAHQPGEWTQIKFELTPTNACSNARLAIVLKTLGALDLGYVSLFPGTWGQYKGLPVRPDIAERTQEIGTTVIRMGGSSVNSEYRWKNMIGYRDQRPPFHGNWYHEDTDGWGVIDFLNFCEAAGILGIPDLNMGETPQDMSDFIEYVNGSPDSKWGRKRVADGHPAPYHLRYVELGNESTVNDAYFNKFKLLAEAMWAKDSGVIPVVGDYHPNVDPMVLTGDLSRITILAAHRKILQLAVAEAKEVWFDYHTHSSRAGDKTPNSEIINLANYVAGLTRLSEGAKFKVGVFEFNGNSHNLERALSNAIAIHHVQRLGDTVCVACNANAFQYDGQNENGWDQGTIFMNPTDSWIQPPGYVLQMVAQNYEPLLVKTDTPGVPWQFDVNTTLSEDHKTLVMEVANMSNQTYDATIYLRNFVPTESTATVAELAGQLPDVNTAQNPERIIPKKEKWTCEVNEGRTTRIFQPYSYTIIRFQ